MELKRHIWDKPALFGIETAAMRIRHDSLFATAIGVALQPIPHRSEYELWTGNRYITSTVTVHTEGSNWNRRLELRRDSDGRWSCSVEQWGDVDLEAPGGELEMLSSAFDCDVGYSPVTNTMPILRANLLRGGSLEFDMAFIEMPSLAIKLSRQTYEYVKPAPFGAIIRFRSGTFQADLSVDEQGIVVKYPGLASLMDRTE
ncbi:MAG: putative glycolipid-binding domain-containing protein [Vulcanimicrobiaceae bacterium]